MRNVAFKLYIIFLLIGCSPNSDIEYFLANNSITEYSHSYVYGSHEAALKYGSNDLETILKQLKIDEEFAFQFINLDQLRNVKGGIYIVPVKSISEEKPNAYVEKFGEKRVIFFFPDNIHRPFERFHSVLGAEVIILLHELYHAKYHEAGLFSSNGCEFKGSGLIDRQNKENQADDFAIRNILSLAEGITDKDITLLEENETSPDKLSRLLPIMVQLASIELSTEHYKALPDKNLNKIQYARMRYSVIMRFEMRHKYSESPSPDFFSRIELYDRPWFESFKSEKIQVDLEYVNETIEMYEEVLQTEMFGALSDCRTHDTINKRFLKFNKMLRQNGQDSNLHTYMLKELNAQGIEVEDLTFDDEFRNVNNSLIEIRRQMKKDIIQLKEVRKELFDVEQD